MERFVIAFTAYDSSNAANSEDDFISKSGRR